MKKILPILAVMLMTSSCGMIMSEDDQASDEPQDSASAEFKVADDDAEDAAPEKVVAQDSDEEEDAPTAKIVQEEPKSKPSVIAKQEVDEDEEVEKEDKADGKDSKGFFSSWFGSDEKDEEADEDKPAAPVMAKTDDEDAPAAVSANVAFESPIEETKTIVVAEPPMEEMRAPVEPRQEDFVTKPMAEVQPSAPLMESHEFGHYKISKGETLMMAAFRIYGDYRKWKELKAWNREELKGGIHSGMELKYEVPAEKFVWQPNGLPYLVKHGNTLGTISAEKYGTSKKWKDIYENNRPLIRNPNIIFAGFTLYYVPARGLASEKK